MDYQNEAILNDYDRNRETFEIIEKVVLDKIQEYIDSQHMLITVFEGRIKSRRSLSGKLDLKGYKYSSITDITDIFGARIVTFYDDEVDKIAAWVAETFDVDWDNSVDKRKLLKEDQFGYRSLHYIARIPKSIYEDDQHPEVNEFRFEIQMRTALQHVWATVFHDTGYKSDIEVPRSYIRRLNRMSGLLELADSEFLEIRNALDAYRDNIRILLSEKRFDELSLDGDTFKDYLNTKPFETLIQRIASINNAEVQETSYMFYLEVLREWDFETIGDIERMKEECSDDVYKWCIKQFEGTDLDIIASGVALQNLLVMHIYKQGYGAPGVKLLLDDLYPKRKSNEKSAKRMVKEISELGIM